MRISTRAAIQVLLATPKSFLATALIFLASIASSNAQTVLLSPTGDGGFENGSTLTANGWTAVNPATDGWVVGSIASPGASAGSNSAYVSNNGGTTWAYSQTSQNSHIYRDFTLPAGESVAELTFKWKAGGEGTTTSDWDNLKVFIAPTTVTPTTAAVASTYQVSGTGAVSGMYKLSSATYNTTTIKFIGTPGSSYRLIFSWKSDVTVIANPPSAIDEVSLISRAAITPSASPTNFTASSISSTGMTIGWTDASTNEEGFRVFMSTDNVNFTKVGADIPTSGSPTYSLPITGLTPSTTYYFQILAYAEGETAPLTGSQITNAAAVYTWNVASGAYSAAASWLPNRTTPESTDILVFDGGTTPTAAVTGFATQTIGQLRVINGANVSLSSGGTATLTLSGGSGTDLEIQSASTLNLTGTSSIGLAFATGSHTGTVNGTLKTSTTGTGTINTTNAVVDIYGTYENAATTNTNTGGNTTRVFHPGSVCNVISNSVNIPGGTWSATSTLNITVTGAATSPTLPSAAQAFGNINYNSPASTGTFNLFGSSTTHTLQGNLAVIAVGSTTTPKFRLVSSGTVSIAGNMVHNAGHFELMAGAGIVNVAGNVTQNGGIFDFNQSTGSSTFRIGGNYIKTGGTAQKTGSTTTAFLEFNGTAPQTVDAIPLAAILSYRINNPSGVTFNGSVQINNSCTMEIKAGNVTSGTIIYGTSGTVLSYTGTGNQTANALEFPSFNGPFTLTINNTGTAPDNQVTVPFNRTVGGGITGTALNLTLGVLNNIGYTLTIANTNAASVSSSLSSTSRYATGRIARTIAANVSGTNTFVFPVGKSGNNGFELLNPVTTSGGTVVVVAEAFDGATGGTDGTSLSAISTTRYWNVEIASGAVNLTEARVRLNDTRAPFDAIGYSSTLAGTYERIGGFPATLATTSIASTAPAIAGSAVPGYYLMASPATPEVSNIILSNPTTQCTNIARTVTATVVAGGASLTGVEIRYKVNGGADQIVAMSLVSGTTWQGTIPTVTPANGVVTFTVVATDASALSGSATGPSYQDEPLFGVTATAVPSQTTICNGAGITLNTNVTGTLPFGNIGTATTITSAAAVSPFSAGWEGSRMQYLVRASELTAAGYIAGNLTSVSFFVTTGYNYTLQNYTIKISHTSASAMGTAFETGSFTTVYGPVGYNPGSTSNALRTINFSTPFAWDGTSNIIVEICHDNDPTGTCFECYSSTSTVRYTATPFNSVYGRYDDDVALCGQPTAGSAISTFTNRPNMQFAGTMNTSPIYNWSDGTNTVGNTQSISVSPSANTSYSVTVTYGAGGCSIQSAPVAITVNELPEAPLGAGSTQCGTAVPAAFVVSAFEDPNVSTNDFRWYDAATGGNLLQTGGSLYTGVISTTTNFYVSEFNGSCESARTLVTATVNPPDAVTAAVSDNEICLGASANLSVTKAGNSQTYTYSWSSTGGSNSGISGSVPGATLSVTPLAPGTYTYTVTAVDGSCTTTSEVSLTVLDLPALVDISATPSVICSGETTTLAVFTNTVSTGTADLGTGTSTTSTTGFTPFNTLFENSRLQYLIRASELTAAGIYPGNISSVAFDVTVAGTTVPLANYTVKMAPTSADALGTAFESGSFTTVYGPASFAVGSTLGWRTISFATPFVWDGTSNIIVEICHDNAACTGGSGVCWGSNATVRYTPTAFNSVFARYGDDIANSCSNNTFGSAVSSYVNRPNMRFNAQVVTVGAGNLDYVWNPGNLTGNSVSATPASTQNFTVTGTDPVTGCANSETVTVTVNQLPPAPTANNSDHCGSMVPFASVSSNSGAVNPIFNWYDQATGGTLLQTGAATTWPNAVDVTTVWYVSETSEDGCEGPRTSLTASVIEADPITAASTSATVCLGGSFDLEATQTGFNNFYDFTWTAAPVTGSGIDTELFGNPVTVTPTEAGTYVYTVVGNDIFSGCMNTATVTVTVNALPSVSATAVPSTVCAGGDVSLQASSIISSVGTATLGSATTTTATAGIVPFSHNYKASRIQYLVRASELSAEGMVAGNINSLSFYITSGTTFPMVNFSLKIAHTATNTMGSAFLTDPLTEVYSSASLVPGTAVGWRTISFDTPFNWDGASNIVIEICHDNHTCSGGSGVCWLANPSVRYTATSFQSVYGRYSDTEASCGVAVFGSATSSTNRANMQFNAQVGVNLTSTLTWEWNPGALTGSTVTVNPTSSTDYTVTATDANGCSFTSAPVSVTTLEVPAAPVVTPSTQCGEGVPTASATGTGGTLIWYDAPTGGNVVQTGGSTYPNSINTTTTFYIAENDGTCEGPRAEWVATVNQPDAITAMAPATSCANADLTLGVTQTGNTNNYVFTWTASPEAGSGITGSISGASQTINPTAAGTYVYTVKGYDASGECNTSSTVTVTITALPVIASATTTDAVICFGETTTLSATSGPGANGVVSVGTGTISEQGASPYRNGANAAKQQYLFTAAELSAAGLTAGNINSIEFFVTTLGSPATITNFTISMAATGSTSLGSTLVPAGTVVYGPVSHTTVAGVNTHTFANPFVWDGTSNVVITVCHEATAPSSSSYVRATAVSGGYSGNISFTAGSNCAVTSGTTGANRPNITFTQPPPYTWTWNPGGLTGQEVNVSPATTTTYSITATDAAGCVSVPGQVELTVLPLPNPPVATNSLQCGVGLPAGSVATGGSNGTFKWYDAPVGGNLVQDGGSTYATVISETKIFWVAENDGSCESERVQITLEISEPDAVTATITDNSICPSESITLNAVQTGNTQNYVFTWSATPEAGSGLVNGTTGSTVTITPTVAGTYTYEVVAFDAAGPCTAISTVQLVVNPTPVITSVVANPSTTCSGGFVQLRAQSLANSVGYVTLGEATTTFSTTGSPYRSGAGANYEIKTQYLLLASELTAANFLAGNINSLGFTTTSSTGTFVDFEIRMGSTSASALTSTFLSSAMTTVFQLPSYSPPANTTTEHLFTTPFVWDGTSNIVIEVRQKNSVLGTSTVSAGPAGFAGTLYAGSLTGFAATTGTTSTTRPLITLNGSKVTNITSSFNWVWNPGNITGSVVNVNPASTTTYTVVATHPTTLCASAPSSVEVLVQPVGATAQASTLVSCAGGAVNLSSNPTGGAPFTFSWSDGTTPIGNAENISVSPTATTTYTVTVTDVCNNSTTSSVTITVNPLPAASIAEAGPINICEPASQTFTAITNVALPSYQWFRNGVVIGGAVSEMYSTNLAGSYTVVVTNTVTGCISTPSAAVVLNVNPQPGAVTVAPSVINTCEGEITQLAASGGLVVTSVSANTPGTSPSGNTSGPSPFYRSFEGSRKQYLLTAAELTSMGMVSGSSLSSVAFQVTSMLYTTDINQENFNIKIGATSQANLSSAFATGLSTVYGPVSYSPVMGQNVFNFSSPFIWNGTSNVVIEVCFDNDPSNTCSAGSPTCWRNSATVTTVTAGAGSVRSLSTDNSSAARDICSITAGASASTSRPLMTFNFTKPIAAGITWSPATGLYTDAAATVAYTGGAATTVYAKPTAGNYTFTATATSTAGCVNSGSAEVNVSPALVVSAEITGPTNPGAHVGTGSPVATYTITADNYSLITWAVPAGATNVSGQGTTSLSFNYPAGYTTGTVSVTVDGIAPCGSITRTLNIACDAPAAPVVSGPKNVCTYIGDGTEATYTIAPDATVSSYNWILPPGVNVVSGLGTGILTVTFDNTFGVAGSKQLRVTATNGCGTSALTIYYLVADKPASLGNITGPNDACGYVGTSNQATYSVAAVDQAESYSWTLPAGVNLVGGLNTNSITVTFDNSFATSAITVNALNSCGTSNTRSITVTRTLPSTPAPITGSTNVCLFMPTSSNPSGVEATYSVPRVGVNTYNWTVPAEATITGQTQTATHDVITVSYSAAFTGGTISVTATNNCGTSPVARTLTLNRLNPGTPSAIDVVNTSSCPTRTYTYSLSAMPANTTSVEWTVPAGGTILSGAGTHIITVEYSGIAIAGDVTATAINGCGTSGTRKVAVKLPACPPAPKAPELPITGTQPTKPATKDQPQTELSVDQLEVTVFPNPSTHAFKLIARSEDKVSKLQVRLLDNLGREHKRFVMMPGETLTLGAELKAGAYFVEVLQGKAKVTKRILKY